MTKAIIKYPVKEKLFRHSEFGIISIILGILGLFVSIIVMYLLNKIFSPVFPDKYAFVKLLNILDKVEIVIKVIGMVTAIIGIMQRNRRKVVSVIGITVNIISVLFTVYLMYGNL
jgi:uncharacterized membrane protein